MKRVLYLGDGPKTGSACYLLGILKYALFSVSHLPPHQKLSVSILRKSFSVIIVSDYTRSQFSQKSLKWIENQVKRGAGFWMIGGWGSFNGLNRGYAGSVIEKILPVSCLKKDDRHNLASGVSFDRTASSHAILREIPLKPSPVLIGYNEVRMKKSGKMLLGLCENVSRKKNPLLVVGQYGLGRTAAWTSDVAPHWCGGLVDWGGKRLRLRVDKKIQVEVGNLYVKFFTQLVKWLSRE